MSRTHRNCYHYSWLQNEVQWINHELDLQYYHRIQQARYPRVKWYDKYIKDDAQVVKEAKEQLNRWQRDGRDGLTASVANTGYKTDAKKTLRRANKSFCRSVLSGDDHENIPLPTKKLGKLHKWDWW